VLPAAEGRQYAKFSNGYVYTAADGQVVEVLGTILDRFLQLGADTGVLGLPLRNAYPVPDGLRADFERGSLILNQLTGIVTTVWKTYNDTYREETHRNPIAAQVSAPIPPNAPAPAASVPGGAPDQGVAQAPAARTPGNAPAQGGAQAPAARTPSAQTPGSAPPQAPAAQAPAAQTPAGQAPAAQTPAAQTSAAQAPGNAPPQGGAQAPAARVPGSAPTPS
jgi:hypothetical protein